MNDDRQSLLPGVDFTRRGFVVTSLAAGFAAGGPAGLGPDHDHDRYQRDWRRAR